MRKFVQVAGREKDQGNVRRSRNVVTANLLPQAMTKFSKIVKNNSFRTLENGESSNRQKADLGQW